jgi:uncharacterized membrane protein YdbT with pleckstrin-like domain
LSLDKNLVAVLDVPSTALKSAVTTTAPDVAAVGVKSIYVPSVVSTVVTPALIISLIRANLGLFESLVSVITTLSVLKAVTVFNSLGVKSIDTVLVLTSLTIALPPEIVTVSPFDTVFVPELVSPFIVHEV